MTTITCTHSLRAKADTLVMRYLVSSLSQWCEPNEQAEESPASNRLEAHIRSNIKSHD